MTVTLPFTRTRRPRERRRAMSAARSAAGYRDAFFADPVSAEDDYRRWRRD